VGALTVRRLLKVVAGYTKSSQVIDKLPNILIETLSTTETYILILSAVYKIVTHVIASNITSIYLEGEYK